MASETLKIQVAGIVIAPPCSGKTWLTRKIGSPQVIDTCSLPSVKDLHRVMHKELAARHRIKEFTWEISEALGTYWWQQPSFETRYRDAILHDLKTLDLPPSEVILVSWYFDLVNLFEVADRRPPVMYFVPDFPTLRNQWMERVAQGTAPMNMDLWRVSEYYLFRARTDVLAGSALLIQDIDTVEVAVRVSLYHR
jgi:hypothetical protein